MVRVREINVIKDPSLLNEKLGPLKLKKLLVVGLGGMLGYALIKKALIPDVVAGIVVILITIMIAFGPDRAVSFENLLQSMTYFYTMKPKTPSYALILEREKYSSDDIEKKIVELEKKINEEKYLINKLILRKDLLGYKQIYYSQALLNVEGKIAKLKEKMKITKNKQAVKSYLQKENKLRAKLRKEINKIKSELNKYNNLDLHPHEKIEQLENEIRQIQQQLKVERKQELLTQLLELKAQYYKMKIDNDKALLRLTKDKSIKQKASTEMKKLKQEIRKIDIRRKINEVE